MKAFLDASCIPAIWVISVLELFLAVLMYIRYSRTKSPIMLLTALLASGLFFDAFMIGLGAFVDAESIRFASRLRFISHGVLIPLLFAICAYALELKKPAKQIVLAITAIFMLLGFAEAVATVIGPVNIAGISRMASVKGQTPVWAEKISRILNYGTVIPLMIVGVVCWIKQKTPHLFLAGFLMFAFSALGPATGNMSYIFYISMYGELVMVLFLYLYAENRLKKADHIN